MCISEGIVIYIKAIIWLFAKSKLFGARSDQSYNLVVFEYNFLHVPAMST